MREIDCQELIPYSEESTLLTTVLIHCYTNNFTPTRPHFIQAPVQHVSQPPVQQQQQVGQAGVHSAADQAAFGNVMQHNLAALQAAIGYGSSSSSGTSQSSSGGSSTFPTDSSSTSSQDFVTARPSFISVDGHLNLQFDL